MKHEFLIITICFAAFENNVIVIFPSEEEQGNQEPPTIFHLHSIAESLIRIWVRNKTRLGGRVAIT